MTQLIKVIYPKYFCARTSQYIDYYTLVSMPQTKIINIEAIESIDYLTIPGQLQGDGILANDHEIFKAYKRALVLMRSGDRLYLDGDSLAEKLRIAKAVI